MKVDISILLLNATRQFLSAKYSVIQPSTLSKTKSESPFTKGKAGRLKIMSSSGNWIYPYLSQLPVKKKLMYVIRMTLTGCSKLNSQQ
ncbi:hypothetical protein D3C76_1167360 [compost metagenome]